MIAVARTLQVVLLSAFCLGGCSGPERPAWLSLNPNAWANRSEADDPLEIEVIGPVAVEVESFNGDVTITGNPEAERATVTLVRQARHGHGRSKEAKRSLDQISMTAEIVPGQLGQLLQVRTDSTSVEPHYLRAHLFIELPDLHGLRVRTTNGRVWARNVRGPVDIATSEADVRVMTNQAMTEQVTIVNRNGDIDYRVRGESTGRFDAQAVNGRVTHLVRYGRAAIEPQTRHDALRATLNDGSNPITLRTVNGDIRIAVVHNPEQVGARIVD